MAISYRVDPGRVTVSLERDLDLASAADARAALDAVLDRYPDRDLLVDLSAVGFIDSTGLGVLLGRYRRLAAAGRAMHLEGVRPAVSAVLTVAGVRQIMSWDSGALDRSREKGAVADGGVQRV